MATDQVVGMGDIPKRKGWVAWRQHGRKEEQGDEGRRRGLWERARRAAKVRKKGKREWEALQIADIYMVQPDGQPRKLSVYHGEERMTSRLSSTPRGSCNHLFLLHSTHLILAKITNKIT